MPQTFYHCTVAARKKRKNYLRVFAWLSMGFALLLFAYLAWVWFNNRPQFVLYREFGIPIPSNYEIHGIDVSRYQQNIAWDAVRDMDVNGIRLHFAFIKATEGTSNKDPYFRRNWRKSREAGVVRGAYHFFVPWKDGRLQAEHFISQVGLESGDLPPVLDVEQIGRTTTVKLREEVKEFLSILEAHYGVKPIIYTNADFYKRHLLGHFDQYPLWVAHYLQPHQPRISRSWSFWQHSETGRVNGIVSKVDFNVFNGDSADFRALLLP